MDWNSAIERNRRLLLPIIAELFFLLGNRPRITLSLRLAVLRLLRPAESAVRRLIVIAARGLAAKPASQRPMPAGRIIRSGGSARKPGFKLFDARKRPTPLRLCKPAPLVVPRIRVITPDPRIAMLWRAAVATVPAATPVLPADDGLVSAARLSRRLEALKLALDDIPRQARRLLRWQARRARPDVYPPRSAEPLRPGKPPGYRAEPDHDVDDILIDCHRLALDALRADTS